MKTPDMQDKVNVCITNEDVLKAIQEFEQIIKNKNDNIIAYGQPTIKDKYFRSLEKKNDLLAMWF